MKPPARVCRALRAGLLALPVVLGLVPVFVLAPGTAAAQEICAGQRTWAEVRSDQKRLRQLLWDSRFELLDAELTSRYQLWQQGRYSEEGLYYALASFNFTDLALVPLLEEWDRKHPRSAPAATARGINAMALGQRARGTAFRQDTSDAQMQEMRRWMGLARESLAAARARDPGFLPAYIRAITVEQYLGTRASVDEIYRAGLKVYPASAYLRKTYLLAIDVRWGGQRNEALDFIRALDRSGLPPATVRFLQYGGLRQLAGTFDTYDQPDMALRLYEEAAPLCQDAEVWRILAHRYHKARQWPQAIDALNQYLRFAPNRAWALRRKAYAFQNLGDWDQAIALYRQAAEMGDDYAQNAYGWQLYQGRHIPKDLGAAILWFERAAAKGNPEARVNLQRAKGEAATRSGR